jgi:hypothetical protein
LGQLEQNKGRQDPITETSRFSPGFKKKKNDFLKSKTNTHPAELDQKEKNDFFELINTNPVAPDQKTLPIFRQGFLQIGHWIQGCWMCIKFMLAKIFVSKPETGACIKVCFAGAHPSPSQDHGAGLGVDGEENPDSMFEIVQHDF